MTKKRKRTKTKHLTGCHRCGKPLTRQGGFIKCTACGHVHGIQGVAYDSRPYDGYGFKRVLPTSSERQFSEAYPYNLDPRGRGALKFKD